MKKSILITLALLQSLAHWSQVTLQGTVSDGHGAPLPGATVLVKNTDLGVVTDHTGAFTLQLPPGDQTLVASYSGYASREVLISAGTTSVVITLLEGIMLREAVVTALGITRSEKSLGYAVQQVQGEDVARVRDVNLINNLSGNVAGMQMTGTSGNLGGSVRILLRGLRSLTGENQPLFVVDGIPLDNSNFSFPSQKTGGGGYDYGSPVQDLNPNDVESVSVLKGQAASALYGSRGSNGVILITLKKGKAFAGGREGIGVTVNTGITFENVLIWPDYQNEYG
ncbi:MAG: TonB-dependent receptor plug domain-containing protein, partial [Thermoanaerobaculia bacterium]|nr:TonB-dependent receptor plug domain-containing protein [Thermoanaerobaculia bacterium]